MLVSAQDGYLKGVILKMLSKLIRPAIATSAALVSYPAFANGKGDVKQGLNATNIDTTTNLQGVFSNVVNVMLFIIGALAVIMLIVGGIMYVTSAGDSKRVESAKNTILYAIIGIVVAIAAGAIVNFIVGKF